MSDLKMNPQLRQNYEGFYEEQDAEWRRLGALDKADNIVALATRYPHETILEIGAGDGSILKRLSELRFGKAYHALEVSSSGVEAIRRRGIASLESCNTYDGYHVPHDDDSFDLAILSHVIEHVEFPRKLIYEVSRLAKYLFVEVPLEANHRLPRDFVMDRTGHINYYSPKTIRRLIQSCNLEVLEQRITNPSRAAYVYSSGGKGRVKHLAKECLLRIAPAIATSFFTYHSALICAKPRG